MDRDWKLPWQRICDVDPQLLIAWTTDQKNWLPNPSRVARVWHPPVDLLDPIFSAVLPHFGPLVRPVCAAEVCLNRVQPGMVHGMHVDSQGGPWITRVHVPIATNPQAWHVFEIDGVVSERVHFEIGGAYSFNTEIRHDFGNEGDADRIHLVFDVYRQR